MVNASYKFSVKKTKGVDTGNKLWVSVWINCQWLYREIGVSCSLVVFMGKLLIFLVITPNYLTLVFCLNLGLVLHKFIHFSSLDWCEFPSFQKKPKICGISLEFQNKEKLEVIQIMSIDSCSVAQLLIRNKKIVLVLPWWKGGPFVRIFVTDVFLLLIPIFSNPEDNHILND